ncbi:MAG: hypothetical protein IPH57_08805 [Saprospiraceae bacterium]|nr:hypothetical protein [Saprospiraceae bacterium]
MEVSNGVKNFIIRIDDDVDLFNLKFPEGTFNITGIGSQHDTISPLLDGYQLCPRYVADIDPYISGNITDILLV